MIEVFLQSITQAYSKKENSISPNRSRTYICCLCVICPRKDKKNHIYSAFVKRSTATCPFGFRGKDAQLVSMRNKAVTITWSKVECSIRASKPAVTVEDIMFVFLIHINRDSVQQPAGLDSFVIPVDAY